LDVFEQPVSFEMMIPMTEYYSLDPPSDDDLSAVAKALAPEPEVEKIPEIVDSVKPEEQKKPEIIEPEKDAEVTKSDTVSGGGSGDDKAGTGPGEDTGIYTTIDVYPRFPGGDQARFYFLRSNIRYPETALKAGIHGVVMLVFVIEPSGEISNVEVAGGIGGGCDEEAVRVIKLMPRWEPGKRSGRAVRVLVRMPIVFKIPGKK
jgi:protein TonB